MNYEHINTIFNAIMAGDPRVITSDNIKFINDEALRIYAIPILVPQDIDELKKIKNFGKKSFTEVVEKIESLGLELQS